MESENITSTDKIMYIWAGYSYEKKFNILNIICGLKKKMSWQTMPSWRTRQALPHLRERLESFIEATLETLDRVSANYVLITVPHSYHNNHFPLLCCCRIYAHWYVCVYLHIYHCCTPVALHTLFNIKTIIIRIFFK